MGNMLTVSDEITGNKLAHFCMMLNPLKAEVHVNDTQNSLSNSQSTQCISITETKQLMLFREIITVPCEKHMEHTNTL
jgi:hypothetical protein